MRSKRRRVYRRVYDGGWYYIEQAPTPYTSYGVWRVRRWHPGYWWYVGRALWQAWNRSVPHG